jgi:hypothetical protein
VVLNHADDELLIIEEYAMEVSFPIPFAFHEVDKSEVGAKVYQPWDIRIGNAILSRKNKRMSGLA